MTAQTIEAVGEGLGHFGPMTEVETVLRDSGKGDFYDEAIAHCERNQAEADPLLIRATKIILAKETGSCFIV